MGAETFGALAGRLPSLAQLESCVAAFGRDGRQQTAAVEMLQQTRMQIVEWIAAQDELTLAETCAGVFESYAHIYLSSIFATADLSPPEQALFAQVQDMLFRQQNVTPQALMMLSLLQPAFRSPMIDLDLVPGWYLKDFVLYVTRSFKLLQRDDDLPNLIAHYQHYLQQALDYIHWPDPVHDIAGLQRLFFMATNLVNIYAAQDVLSDLWALHAALAESCLRLAGARLAGPVLMDPIGSQRRLRVGILAHNFAASAEGLFAFSHWHDLPRDRYDLTLFSFVGEPAGLEHRAARHADGYVALDCLSPKDGDLFRVVETIRAARLDLLVIATNVSSTLQFMVLVASHRMARIQIINSATPVPAAFHAVDGYLSGTFNERPDGQHDYPARLMMVDGSVNYYAYHLDRLEPTMLSSRASLGLPEGKKLVFANGNFFKLTPGLLQIWARIMAQCPDAHLVMMPFTPGWQGGVMPAGPLRDLYGDIARTEGADPTAISILDEVPARADRHQIMALCDVYLDCFPFSGACSMLDPLLVGLPMAVRSVPHFRGLLSTAMLLECGLGDMAAAHDDAYIARAVRLIHDDAFRAAEGARVQAVRDAGLPFFDSARYGRKLTDVFDAALHERAARDAALMMRSAADLEKNLEDLLNRLDPARLPMLAGLDMEQLMGVFIAGFYQSHPLPMPGHMIDVGGFVGVICRPLLALGWCVDLFEPDPVCGDMLNRLRQTFPGQLGIIHAAVGPDHGVSVPFCLSEPGLSGRHPAPMVPQHGWYEMPCFRLDAFRAEMAIPQIDVLKIHANGDEWDVLDSYGYDMLSATDRPCFVLIHFDNHHDVGRDARIHDGMAAMAAAGYRALIFSTDTSRAGVPSAVARITTDQPVADAQGAVRGHILFYRDDRQDVQVWILRQLAGFLHDRDRPVWA